MKLSELISKAQILKKQVGDLEVVTDDLALLKEVDLRRDPSGELRVACLETHRTVESGTEFETLLKIRESLLRSYSSGYKKLEEISIKRGHVRSNLERKAKTL